MPWHQQPGETEVAYAAFKTFLNLEKRSYKATAEALSCSIGLINYYSPRYDWRERARQYDNWRGTQLEENRVNQLAKFQAKLIAGEAADYDLITKEWREIFKRSSGDMSLADLSALVDARMKIDSLGRRVAELPTTYTANTLAVKAANQSNDDRAYVLGWSDPHMKITEGDIIDGDSEEIVMLGDGDADRSAEAS